MSGLCCRYGQAVPVTGTYPRYTVIPTGNPEPLLVKQYVSWAQSGGRSRYSTFGTIQRLTEGPGGCFCIESAGLSSEAQLTEVKEIIRALTWRPHRIWGQLSICTTAD